MTEKNSLESHAEETSEWPLDELFRSLSTQEGRITLRYLSDREQATLDELSTVVAGYTAAKDRRVGGETDYERARIQLFHSVLPQLDDHGILEFDPDEGVVRNVEIPPAISTVLGVDE